MSCRANAIVIFSISIGGWVQGARLFSAVSATTLNALGCPHTNVRTFAAPEVSVVTLARSTPSLSAMLLAQPIELLLVGRGQGDEQALAIHRRWTQVGVPFARTQVARRLQHVIAQSRRPTQGHVRSDKRDAQLWWGCDAYHAEEHTSELQSL